MNPVIKSPHLTPDELIFIKRRETLVWWWPRIGAGLFTVLAALFVFLLRKSPLLVRPDQVWTGLGNGLLEPVTVQLLAAMLPVVVLGWIGTIVLIIMYTFVGVANERKLLGFIRRVRGKLNGGDRPLSFDHLSLDHIVLTVQNIETSVRFYCDVLRMRKEVFGINRTALHFGTQKINLHELGREVSPHASYPVTGSADFCLLTDEPLETVMARVAGFGIDIIEGPVEESGARGPMQSLYMRDPDGNLVEVARLHDAD